MKLLSVSLVVLGVVGLVAAGYLYSFGLPLESACHMGDPGACVRLAHAMNTSRWTALGAIALAFGGLLLPITRRTRRLDG